MEKKLILNNSVLHDYSLVLFDPLIGPYEVLPLWARVDGEVMAVKGYSKAPALLKPHHQIA